MTFCGYSNCFRQSTAKRGFMPVCPVHLAEPRKWGKDGKTFTGSTFVKREDRSGVLHGGRGDPTHREPDMISKPCPRTYEHDQHLWHRAGAFWDCPGLKCLTCGTGHEPGCKGGLEA